MLVEIEQERVDENRKEEKKNLLPEAMWRTMMGISKTRNFPWFIHHGVGPLDEAGKERVILH